ncbi:MAG: hypothetical protein ACR2NX_12405, partial [Chthoniobacterales bacterium]
MIAAYCSSMVAPGKVLTLSLVVMTAFTAVAQRANASGSIVAVADDRRALVKDTPEKLLASIQLPALWQHLSDFQAIADQHPDRAGHGNRDTGTAGYKASVDYV